MKDLFSGSLGKLNNHGGSRMFTTPNTISVPHEQDDFLYRLPMIRSEVNITHRDVDTLKSEVGDIKHDITSLKADVVQLKQDTRILQNDVAELKSDVKNLRVDVSDLKGEVRTFSARLDGMDKRIDDMQESQNKWFTLLGLLVTIVPIAIAVIQSIISN